MLQSRERWLHDNHFFFGEFKGRVLLLGDVSFGSVIHQIVIVMVGHKRLYTCREIGCSCKRSIKRSGVTVLRFKVLLDFFSNLF